MNGDIRSRRVAAVRGVKVSTFTAGSGSLIINPTQGEEMATEGFTQQFDIAIDAPAASEFFTDMGNGLESDIQYPIPGVRKIRRTRILIVVNTLTTGPATFTYRKNAVDTPVTFTIDPADAPGTVKSVDSSEPLADSDLLSIRADLPIGELSPQGVVQTLKVNWTWELDPA